MKMKLLILVILIVISSFPANFVQSQVDENVPDAPTFQALVPNGVAGNHIFAVNETVTVKYQSDRFSIEGVILVGNGSGLHFDPEHENVTQMERVSSSKGISTWEVKINVTSYTYFYAYSWYNGISNRTMEELDLLDGAPGHQMWLNTGPTFPRFSDVLNSTSLDSSKARNENVEFYASRYANVTVVYEVTEQNNQTEFVTLSFSNSSEGVYNGSTSLRVNMTQTTFSVNSKSRFEYELNLTQRLIYFAAFNSFGWDRKLESLPTPITRSVNTGFKFDATFSEPINQYTSLDTISFNVTSTNETSDDLFSYRYRYFANSTSQDPLLNWTDIPIDGMQVSQYEENVTISDSNHTQLITIYQVVLEDNFNVSQVVHIQPYVTYNDESYNATLRIIEIHDPRPTITVLTGNNTATGDDTTFIDWEFSTVRGSITFAKLTSDQTDIDVTVTAASNYTYFFENDTSIIEGYHKVTINATSTFTVYNTTDSNFTRYEMMMWNITTLVFQVDVTDPIGSFIDAPTTAIQGAFLTLKFEFSDPGISPSGIDLVKLDWGDNTAINVTSLSQASHTYRYGNSYTITLTVWDKVGRNASFSIPVEIVLPTTQKSSTNDSPVSIIYVVGSISFLVLIIQLSRRPKNRI